MNWNSESDFPDEFSSSGKTSVDVLVYNEKTDEHTIGWFDFNVMTWRFLCRESIGKFQWRYFVNEYDKTIK